MNILFGGEVKRRVRLLMNLERVWWSQSLDWLEIMISNSYRSIFHREVLHSSKIFYQWSFLLVKSSVYLLLHLTYTWYCHNRVVSLGRGDYRARFYPYNTSHTTIKKVLILYYICICFVSLWYNFYLWVLVKHSTLIVKF